MSPLAALGILTVHRVTQTNFPGLTHYRLECLERHKEFDKIILLNVFLIILVCLNMNIRFGTINPNLIFIFKHTKTIKNTFNNMILSNSLWVFQDTLDGNGLIVCAKSSPRKLKNF